VLDVLNQSASPALTGDAFYGAPMVTAWVPRVKHRELTVTAPGCGPRDRDHGLLSGFCAGLPTAPGVTDQNAAGNVKRGEEPHPLALSQVGA
jgi:hypothetical protein